MPGTRIKQKDVIKGISKTRIMGRHRLERNVNVVGANVKTPSLVKKNIKLDAEIQNEPKSARVDTKKTAENEFMAKSSDMRGKKKGNSFRGKQVYDWSPARDFRPDAVGGLTAESGAFTGGFVNQSLMKQGNNAYVQQAGYQKGSLKKTLAQGETLERVNPFAVSIRVKGSNLRFK